MGVTMKKMIRIYNVDLGGLTLKQKEKFVSKVLKEAGFDLSKTFVTGNSPDGQYKEYSQDPATIIQAIIKSEGKGIAPAVK